MNNENEKTPDYPDISTERNVRLIKGVTDWPPIKTPQYHYTSLDCLPKILRSGEIQPGCWTYMDDPICICTWTSSAIVWEPACSATSMFSDYASAALRLLVMGGDYPLARIEVDPSVLYEWSAFMEAVGVHWGCSFNAAQSGIDLGCDPGDWAVCPTAIPASAWRSVDLWQGGIWEPIHFVDRVDPNLIALLPPHIQQSPIGYTSEGNAWLLEVREKGSDDWISFLDSVKRHHLEEDFRNRALTKEELVEEVCMNESEDNVYRLMLSMGVLSNRKLRRLIKLEGEDVLDRLTLNPPFALAVAEYFSMTASGMVEGIKKQLLHCGASDKPKRKKLSGGPSGMGKLNHHFGFD